MHFAAGVHVVIQLNQPRFLGRQYRANFGEGPGEIIAVIVEGLIGILAAVEPPASLIGENFVDPGDDAFGGFAEQRISGDLIAVQIIFQQLGIVVGHFFEVGDAPAFVDGVAMEAAGDLIVDAALGHAGEGAFGDVQQTFGAGGLVAFKQQIGGTGVREFRGLAEAAVLVIEHAERGFDDGVDDSRVEFAARGFENFGFGYSVFQGLRGGIDFFAARFE